MALPREQSPGVSAMLPPTAGPSSASSTLHPMSVSCSRLQTSPGSAHPTWGWEIRRLPSPHREKTCICGWRAGWQCLLWGPAPPLWSAPSLQLTALLAATPLPSGGHAPLWGHAPSLGPRPFSRLSPQGGFPRAAPGPRMPGQHLRLGSPSSLSSAGNRRDRSSWMLSAWPGSADYAPRAGTWT